MVRAESTILGLSDTSKINKDFFQRLSLLYAERYRDFYAYLLKCFS